VRQVETLNCVQEKAGNIPLDIWLGGKGSTRFTPWPSLPSQMGQNGWVRTWREEGSTKEKGQMTGVVNRRKRGKGRVLGPYRT